MCSICMEDRVGYPKGMKCDMNKKVSVEIYWIAIPSVFSSISERVEIDGNQN